MEHKVSHGALTHSTVVLCIYQVYIHCCVLTTIWTIFVLRSIQYINYTRTVCIMYSVRRTYCTIEPSVYILLCRVPYCIVKPLLLRRWAVYDVQSSYYNASRYFWKTVSISSWTHAGSSRDRAGSNGLVLLFDRIVADIKNPKRPSCWLVTTKRRTKCAYDRLYTALTYCSCAVCCQTLRSRTAGLLMWWMLLCYLLHLFTLFLSRCVLMSMVTVN